MKPIRLLLLLFLLLPVSEAFSQNDGMVSGRRKPHKKVWRRWNKKRDAYNPYLKKKNKDKPSVQEAKGDKREIRRQRREYKRQLKQGKKNTR